MVSVSVFLIFELRCPVPVSETLPLNKVAHRAHLSKITEWFLVRPLTYTWEIRRFSVFPPCSGNWRCWISLKRPERSSGYRRWIQCIVDLSEIRHGSTQRRPNCLSVLSIARRLIRLPMREIPGKINLKKKLFCGRNTYIFRRVRSTKFSKFTFPTKVSGKR